MRKLAGVSFAVALGGGLVAGTARAEVPDTPAWRANVGLVTSTGIAVLLPDEGSAGGGLELSGRYGIPAGPVIFAPGVRLGGYYLQERIIGVLMPTARLTVPLGPLAPFVHAGAGAGGAPGATIQRPPTHCMRLQCAKAIWPSDL